QEFLTFGLGGEEYGIPILNVQEIIGYVRPTPIPNTPSWVSGVINIRGVVIPVVDVRTLFSMSHKDYDATSVIIVTMVGERVIGAVVDQVNDVLAFKENEMQDTPEVANDIRTDYITGLGKLGDRLVMLLDMAEVLSGENLQALAESAATVHHDQIRSAAQTAHAADAKAAAEAAEQAKAEKTASRSKGDVKPETA
ncbi:MAG: chemotaxis protein CheW, partial [Nitrospirota bacterium]|nr:chemotaxis protein CheW [Nitrospirota bacterium]